MNAQVTRTDQAPTRREIQKIRSKRVNFATSIGLAQHQALVRRYSKAPTNELVQQAIEEVINLQLAREEKLTSKQNPS